jgi:predicted chitinase
MSFEQLPAAYLNAQWHFHPVEFIQHFRKCGWLDEADLAVIYSVTEKIKREQYRCAMNKVMRKYGITTPLRQAHFLGQGAVESSALRSMQETSMVGKTEDSKLYGTFKNTNSEIPESELGHWYGSLSSEDDPWYRLEKFTNKKSRITGSYSWINGNCGDIDAQKFRGRGFKQLTGRSNYADYWLFRSWLKKTDFTQYWWTDPKYKERNVDQMKMRPAKIDTPQKISNNPFNCIDSGGWYLACFRANTISKIDRDVLWPEKVSGKTGAEFSVSRAVTLAINGGYIDDGVRFDFTVAAKVYLR